MKNPKSLGKPLQMADLQQAHRLLQSLSRITRVINTSSWEYKQRLGMVLEIILDYMTVEQGSIMLLEKKRHLVVKAASRPELVGRSQSIEDEDRVASWVVKHAKPLFIPDISRDSRFKPRGHGHAYKKEALLSVPILHAEQVIGVINVADKSGQRDLFQEDIAYLLEFSGLIFWLILQQKLQDELKKRQKTLRQRNKELRRQEGLRAELSRMLIHDLKGPLSEVVANLDILSYSIPEEQREFLEAAQISCDRAVRMASDLVQAAKLEDGKVRLLKEGVDPLNILEESITSVKGLARIRGVALVLQSEDGLPVLQLDRVLILRVLQNLLTNSLGYSPPNSSITVGCRRLPGKRSLEFFIQDQGPGIPADKQEFIFEKYARISARQDTLVGTGLGLYFCRLAVELHRGEIHLESEPDQGSRFCFTLPL